MIGKIVASVLVGPLFALRSGVFALLAVQAKRTLRGVALVRTLAWATVAASLVLEIWVRGWWWAVAVAAITIDVAAALVARRLPDDEEVSDTKGV